MYDPRYARPPFPKELWDRFVNMALKYGFEKKGSKWLFMERMLDKAETEPWGYDQIEK